MNYPFRNFFKNPRKLGVFFLSCALFPLFLLTAWPGAAFSKKSGPERSYFMPRWSEIILEGSRPLTRFLVRVRLSKAKGICPYPLSEMKIPFLTCPIESPDVLLISAETVTMSLLLPQEKYEHFVWFRPDTGEALQRLRWKKSGKEWLKLYRWEEDAVKRLSIRPKNEKEKEEGPSGWSKRYISFYPLSKSTPSEGEAALSEPLVLLYLAAHAGMSRATSPEKVRLFGKKGVHEVVLRFKKRKRIKLDYTERVDGQERSRREKARVFVYTISSRQPETGHIHRERFSLLGLQQDIEIYVDVKRGMVVRIEGENDLVGKVDLRLVSVTLRKD